MSELNKPPAVSDNSISVLLDKQAITELLETYARAIDTSNEGLLRAVFHPESQHNHGFVGPSSDPDSPKNDDEPGDFVGFALNYLQGFSSSHHQLGNPLIKVTGDTAQSECYFIAHQIMRAKGDPLAPANASNTETLIALGGRYIDKLEKRDGVWKIIHRSGNIDWSS